MRRAVRAPLRSRSVLITTVEPWRKTSGSLKRAPALSTPCAIPSTIRCGVLSALPSSSLPAAASKYATSVKVPPISAARRLPLIITARTDGGRRPCGGIKMNMFMLTRFLAALTFAFAAVAQAQSWPAKPIQVIVNVAPAGTADVTARLLAPRLAEALGQPIVIDNRSGGDGYVGMEAVARAEPDGYLLLYSPGSRIMMAPHLVQRADLDPVKALAPVAPTGRISLFLMVHPGVPAKDLAGFLQYARSNPGKINYGTPGTGTAPHIAAEVFSREAGVTMTHIPYKGAGPVLRDLLGGQIDLAFDSGTGLPQAKAGKLRLLAVVGAQRRSDFPDVPTVEEAGFKGVDGGPHFGFYAPARTPRAIVERFNREVAKLMQEPAIRERFEAQGLEVAPPMTGDAFAGYVRAESDRYAKLLPQLGLAK